MACLDLEGRHCLVVGGGSVGLEKASGLIACGARVTVVSPTLDDRFADFDVDWIARRYQRWDLRGHFLVVAANVGPQGERKGLPRRRTARNAVQRRRRPGPVQLHPPSRPSRRPDRRRRLDGRRLAALAKRLRSQIAALVRPEHAELAEELRSLRPAVKEQFATYEERRDHFEDLVTERLA